MVFFPYIVYERPMGPNTTAGETRAKAATTLAATTAVVSFHVLVIISMVFFSYIVYEPLIGPNTTAGATTTEAATTLAT